MYCEYSTGSGIDRKNRRVREAELVADWISFLFRWLIAIPDRAARVLETGWTAVADRAAGQWGVRRFERGSLGRELPYLRSIRWMTNCLGQGWISVPLGLSPALASRAANRELPRFVFRGAPGFIHNDHFLSCSESMPGFMAPALGARGHSTDFSMPAYAADL